MHGSGAEAGRGAPIAGLYTHVRDGIVDDRVIAQRGDDQWVMRGLQPTKGIQIKVVIVIVGQQHRVDFWQIAKGDAGGSGTFGTGKGKRAGAV